jgi:putative pyruvate formate lyase activating enzyme
MPEPWICTDCPRACSVLRGESQGAGRCGCGALPVVARAAPHYGEEPCISGERGSGTVFFSGCNLGCVFCQNTDISQGRTGKQVSIARLREIFRELISLGVHNLNLVTPSHFVRAVAEALEGPPLPVPVAWNSSGYDSAPTLRLLDGKIQIYMPDLKYLLPAPAARYSGAADYPAAATAAIREMYRQTGPFVLDRDGMLQRGVLIRHLVLPGQLENTRRVIDWVSREFPPDGVMLSLMSQYTPLFGAHRFPEIDRPLSQEEHETAVNYLLDSGIEAGFYQDLESSGDEMIPEFDGTGV